MVMRKALAASVVAAVVGTSIVSAASAAPVAKTVAAVQVTQSTFAVNGNAVAFRVVTKNGETLVSVRDLAQSIGANIAVHNGALTVTLNGHTVVVKLNEKQLTADGASVSLKQPIQLVNGSTYIALRPFIAGLGGTVALSDGQISVSTVKLVEGAENPRFVSASKLLVSTVQESGRTDYLVDTKNGKSEVLLTSTDKSDLVVAPNGKKAIFSDNEGLLYLIDLSTKVVSKLSSDNNIKPELVWSPDSGTVYFLQGDKGSVIAKINVATGEIAKILDDKVDYKSSLNVSADGSKFVYAVTTLGKVTADSTNVDEDKVDIDYSANQIQLFSFDSSVKDAKPVQLTKETDDKVFISSVDGASAAYVSIADENANAVLVGVAADGASKNLYNAHDVIDTVLSGGKLYVLAANSDTENGIYEVSTTGAATQLYTVSADVSAIVVSESGIAVVRDGQILVRNGNGWTAVTK
ncbi:stalk domain-containing protein [Cohnella sp. AR92]|uniref:stalk domain-containing protein n=1 Tax=Cohnella sp. AR92 TaxID=648716 RepID=UPI000F8EC685|nr:stalk domain-containing protein [Cohnella sp. AR92]RUS48700.1 hypothetical protein ELR57_04655 [Cohnella sp. AR92]